MITRPFEPGWFTVAGDLVLDRIVFDEPVHLEFAAWRLSCKRTRFRAGGHLRVAWAEISLESAEVGAPLILSGEPPPRELAGRVSWLRDPGESDPRLAFPQPMPSLISVRHADVAGLVLSDIDLRDCHFAGAYHLDQLQISSAAWFRHAPSGRGSRRGRRVLAEECEWRLGRGGWRARRWRHTTSELFRPPLLNASCELVRRAVDNEHGHHS